MSNAVVLLAGLLPLYVVRFSVFGIPTNVFEVAVWALFTVEIIRRLAKAPIRKTRAAGKILVGETLGVDAKTPRVKETSTLAFIILFLLAAIISTIISPIPSSLGIFKGWIITPLLFGFLVRRAVGKTLGVLPSTPLSLDGERDGVRGIRVSQSLEEIGVINSLILSGLVVALLGLSQIQGFNRIQSLYDVPNSLALFLVPVCVLAGWIGMKSNNKFYQYAAIIVLIAIVFTQSTGAIIALVGTIVVGMFVNQYTHPLQLPLEKGERSATSPPLFKGRLGGVRTNFLRIFAFLFVAITFFTFSGRLSYLISPLTHPGTTNSITVRMQLWDIGTSLITKYPLFGIGLGQFEPAYQAELHSRFAAVSSRPPSRDPSRQPQPEFIFRDPHNWIVSFWLNLGILGLVSFIALNFLAIKRGCSNSNIYQQAVALALISILIFGLFDTIYWKNDLSALWWMLVLLQTKVTVKNQ